MKKKIIFGIIIGLLMVVGVVYYILYPKGNVCWPYCQGMTDQDRDDIKKSTLDAQTINWKTFYWDSNNISFKYPTNWKVDIKRTSEGPEWLSLGPIEKETSSIIFGSNGATCSNVAVATKCKNVFFTPIYTISTNLEVLQIFDLIVANVGVIKDNP